MGHACTVLVWKSQPSLNDFDAGALRSGGKFWLSPVTGLSSQICWPRPGPRGRLRFPAVSSISILQASVCMGWDRATCMYSHADPKIDFRWPREKATELLQEGAPRGASQSGCHSAGGPRRQPQAASGSLRQPKAAEGSLNQLNAA